MPILLTSIDKHSSVFYSTRRYQQTINHMQVHIFFKFMSITVDHYSHDNIIT